MRVERNLLLDSAACLRVSAYPQSREDLLHCLLLVFGTRVDPCSRDGEWAWLADLEGSGEWGQFSREDKWAISLFTGDVFVFNHREPSWTLQSVIDTIGCKNIISPTPVSLLISPDPSIESDLSSGSEAAD